MSWWYNSDTGAVDQTGWPQSLWNGTDPLSTHAGIGWHGPFNSKQSALDYYANNHASNPGWKAPTGYLNTIKNGAEAIPGEVNRVTNAVTDPLGKFNLGGWFLRIGEIVLGLILVGVGVAKLTNTQNAIAKAAKVALA